MIVVAGTALIVIITVVLLTKSRKEGFDDREILATSQRLNFHNYLQNYNVVSIPPTVGWDYVLYRLNTRQPLSLYKKATKVIMEPLDYIENAEIYPSEPLPAGYFFFLAKTDDFECGFDFSDKRVGYFDSCEKRLIDAVTFGYRINAKTIQITNFDAIWDAVDILVAYIVPKSPLSILIERQHLHILDISNINIHRLRLTYPMLSLETIEKTDVFDINNRLVSSAPIIPVLKMSMLMVSLVEPFITRLELSPEYLDPEYKCIGNEEISSNALCKSPYDIHGKPKIRPTMIDKPCSTDSDCPYYNANKNYPNSRGGCLSDGTCEMPIGVKRLGYTKHYGDPFCYNCRGKGNDRFCCEAQSAQVARNQTRLQSADYAFPNDIEDRKRYGLQYYLVQ